MTGESNLFSNQRSESWNVVLKWVTLLACHFHADLSEPEIQIYCEALQNKKREMLEMGFQHCLHECSFMPKVSEIESRMPEGYQGTAPLDIGADFVPVKDWYEPHTETHNLHVWMDRYGRKKVQDVVKSSEQNPTNWPQHWPEKNCKPMTWDEAREKLKICAIAKTL